MSESAVEMKLLHRRAGQACTGDVGWAWWMGEWCPARILEDNGETFAVLLMPDGSEWLPIGPDEDDKVAAMPWFDVSRPPYEMDEPPEQQPTHSLTYQDGAGLWTCSWRMPLDRGEMSRAIFEHLQGMLKSMGKDRA